MKFFPKVDFEGMKILVEIDLRGMKIFITKIRGREFCTEKIRGRKKLPTPEKKYSGRVVLEIHVQPLNVSKMCTFS